VLRLTYERKELLEVLVRIQFAKFISKRKKAITFGKGGFGDTNGFGGYVVITLRFYHASVWQPHSTSPTVSEFEQKLVIAQQIFWTISRHPSSTLANKYTIVYFIDEGF
jgi:hypothetical protein